MNAEQIELATQLAAHERWSWRMGISYTHPDWGESGLRLLLQHEARNPCFGGLGYIPALDLPSTWGHLMAMIIEAGQRPNLSGLSWSGEGEVGELLAQQLLYIWNKEKNP